MINVIQCAFASTQIDQVFDRCDEIFVSQNSLGGIDVDPEFLIDLAGRRDPNRFFGRRRAFSASAGVRDRRWITWAKTTVDVLERFLLIGAGSF
jgi:hypothetical protein